MNIQTAQFIVTGLHAREQWSFLQLLTPDLAPQATQTRLNISEKLQISLQALAWQDSEAAAFEEALGIILLIDGRQAASFADLPPTLKQLAKRRPLPVIVAVRGEYDIPTLTAIRQGLDERQQENIKIFPCPDEAQAAQNVLMALIYQMLST